MEKVKLIQEQADAIEEVLKRRTRASIVRERANVFLRSGMYIGKSNHIVFYEMDLETIIKALYIGYEVEETIKVGDWVAYDYWGLVGKVICIDGGIALDNRPNRNLNPKDFNFATPEEIAEEKERRWWAEHGRDVRELRSGDVLAYIGEVYRTVRYVTNEHLVLSEGDRKELDIIEKMWDLGNVKVVCFVEDRKDVEE